jgi:TolB protein
MPMIPLDIAAPPRRPPIMLIARIFLTILILLALNGCYPTGGAANQEHTLHAPPPIPRSKSSTPDPQLPDNALFPIVNIYGELRPAIYRTGQARASASFQQHTSTDEGHDADVVLDPSGRWLAFSSTRHSERADIYLQRVDGSSVIQLTSDPADDVHPCFSADGSKIAFASSRAGTWDIYIMDIDGKNVEQLTSGPPQDLHPSFSPDGSRLVYCSLSRGDQWELWLLNLQSKERKTLGPGLFPTWSPRRDIDRIAFQRARQRGGRWFSIWTLDLIDGEPRRNAEIAVSSNAAVVSPAWSPDGSHLAFTTILQPARPSDDLLPQQEVWIVSADGSGRQRIAEGNTNLSPFWSVTNRIYFISDRGGQENIWSVRVDPAKTATANISEPQSNSKQNNKGPGIAPPTPAQRSVDIRDPGNP